MAVEPSGALVQEAFYLPIKRLVSLADLLYKQNIAAAYLGCYSGRGLAMGRGPQKTSSGP